DVCSADRVVSGTVRENQNVLGCRIAAEPTDALEQNSVHLFRIREPLLAEREGSRGVDLPERHAVVRVLTMIRMRIMSGHDALRCTGNESQDFTCPLVPTLTADEEPHDADLAHPLRLQLADGVLQARRVGPSRCYCDRVAIAWRLDRGEHALVPFLRPAVRHPEHTVRIIRFGLLLGLRCATDRKK